MLRFFLEYQWLIDFAVYATGVFLFTECYYSVVDARKEVNIGAIWCVLTVLFGLYPSSVTQLFFLRLLSGEVQLWKMQLFQLFPFDPAPSERPCTP